VTNIRISAHFTHLRKFRNFFATEVTIFSNHNLLMYLRECSPKTTKLTRWAQEFMHDYSNIFHTSVYMYTFMWSFHYICSIIFKITFPIYQQSDQITKNLKIARNYLKIKNIKTDTFLQLTFKPKRAVSIIVWPHIHSLNDLKHTHMYCMQ